MLKVFPIEFVKQALEQTMYEEHLRDVNLFGGKNQINILSFYEQLKNQDEVYRFVQTFRDITKQQNRTSLIGNGVIMAPENPTITNLYSSLIVPMSWTCSLRCTLGNRDQMIVTINNLIEKLKGRKVDVAQLECQYDNGGKYYVPFKVGTIGQNDGAPTLKNGDYIGEISTITDVDNLLNNIKSLNVNIKTADFLYCGHANKIKVVKITRTKGNNVVDTLFEEDIIQDGRYVYTTVGLDNLYTEDELWDLSYGDVTLYGDTDRTIALNNGVIHSADTYQNNGITCTKLVLMFDLGNDASTLCPGWNGTFVIENQEVYLLNKNYSFIDDDGTYDDIVFPPTHTSFEKYKLSLSFDATRCDEPRLLNEEEYCEISFGGSATLVSKGVLLGNDLLKVSISKTNVEAETPVSYSSNTTYLEPLEMPSGNNLSNQVNQLMSAKFLTKPHTDSLTPTIQYTFILDSDIKLLNVWFNLARYGYWSLSGNNVDTKVSPNTQYTIYEWWSSWGEIKNAYYLGKIVENIDIENTESDVLTISVSFQVVGNE